MKNILFAITILCMIKSYSAQENQSETMQSLIQKAHEATINAEKAATVEAQIQTVLEQKQCELQQVQEHKNNTEAEKIKADIVVLEKLAEKLNELFAHLAENGSSQLYERTVSGWAGTSTHKDVFAATHAHELGLFIPQEGTITDPRMQEIASGLKYFLQNSSKISFLYNSEWERCEKTTEKIICSQRIIQSLNNQKSN